MAADHSGATSRAQQLTEHVVEEADDMGVASRGFGRERVGRVRVDLSFEPDRDLVVRAAKGDDRAWTELTGLYGAMILHVAQRTGLSRTDATDVQQETWMQLMRHADQVRDPDRIGAWLATTARRQSLKVAMASRRHALSAEPGEEYGSREVCAEDLEAAALRHDYEPALEGALNRLPVLYRRLLELLASDASPSYREVAAAMNLPVGSIGPLRLRALTQLRNDADLQNHAA